jgi:hypothetical protein
VSPRRPIRPAEAAARRELRALPKPYSDSVVAKGILVLAQLLDDGQVPRDAAALQREIRLSMEALHALAPAKAPDDFVDEVRAKREKNMREAASSTG